MKHVAFAVFLAFGLTASAHAGLVANGANTHFQAIASIRGAWEKFTKSQGPLKLTVDKLEESANVNGLTATANVQFEGKTPIKVRDVLVYRDNMIVSETWQIDSKLVVAGAMPATTVSAKSTY